MTSSPPPVTITYVPPPFESTPGLPDFATYLMPENAFDAQISAIGVRLGWMKGHECPCTYSGATPGAAKPNCLTCLGRGVYWEANKILKIVGGITFMHTSSAPDEPGFHIHDKIGPLRRAEPTLTLIKNGPNNENTVYNEASIYDAYIEYDGASRLSATLISGTQEILPYQQGIVVETVTTYDAANRVVKAVTPNQWTSYGAQIILDPKVFPIGTPYVVSFSAMPVWVAYRGAGGEAHVRPFGSGTGGLPKRFRCVALDAWTRASFNGEAPQGQPMPNTEGISEPIVPGISIPFDSWA